MKLEALPEATVVHTKVPVFQITTSGQLPMHIGGYTDLVQWLEHGKGVS